MITFARRVHKDLVYFVKACLYDIIFQEQLSRAMKSLVLSPFSEDNDVVAFCFQL